LSYSATAFRPFTPCRERKAPLAPFLDGSSTHSPSADTGGVARRPVRDSWRVRALGFEPFDAGEGLGPGLGIILSSPTCSDGIANGDEGGVDCGGSECAPCPNDSGCSAGADCGSGVCGANVCRAPTCSDAVRNQDEADTDCGGNVCGSCGTGAACAQNADCASSICTNNACQSGSCSDGVRNQDETSTDCGGACGSTCSVLQAALVHR